MAQRRKLSVLVFAAALAGGCQNTNVAPIRDGKVELAPDEKRVWARSAEEEARLDRSGLRPGLPEVERYLTAIVDQLHPGPLANGTRFRVRVLADPSLNAFALPNGALYVHTGLLARVENEAQIATVLAHEISHATHRHSLKGMRSLKNKTAVMSTISVGAGGFGLGGSVASLLGAVGTLAAVSGYSQDLEREADAVGFDLLLRAGYDPRESVQIFRKLRAEAERKEQKEPFFFGSHPRLSERIGSYEDLIERSGMPGTTRIAAAEYEAAALPAIVENADAALAAGDADFALDSALRALASRPRDPQLLFISAEARRKRAKQDDLQLAREILQDLTAQQPEFPDAHRGFGMILMKAGEKKEAAAAFRRYLALRPTAGDRGYVEQFIQQCDTES